MPSSHHQMASTLKHACTRCAKDPACRPEVRACCECLLACLDTGVECHAMVHACRDIAARCACEACLARKGGWRELCSCCFELIDACDSYCHQRCSLPEMLRMYASGGCDLRCAFKTGPTIPGTAAYTPPSRVAKKCCVYCANSSCGAERSFCERMPKEVTHLTYPGGLLEYHCRTHLDPSLPRLKGFDPARFRHRSCTNGCVP